MLQPTPEEPEIRVIGQSTALIAKHRAILVDDSVDKTVTFNPTVDTAPPTNYFAPMPSTSFTNISRIEKVFDPLDSLAFNNNVNFTASIPYIDLAGESEERKKDADYIPSSRATSDSDISIVETPSHS